MHKAQNPLDTFPRIAGEVGIFWQQVVVMEFGEKDTTKELCPHQLVTDLLYWESGVMDFGLYCAGGVQMRVELERGIRK